jgi:CDP-diacylglycerol pyrophosphatase
MCNCADGFVHGLAIPFARISGIEAEGLPDGIWAFAWKAARSRISDPTAIALVVNPPLERTQDQLHIHLVRLRPKARSSFPEGSTVMVSSLDQVWSVAKTIAARLKLDNYGLLVAKALQGDGFTVVVQEFIGHDSPESQYTENRCTGS